MQDLALYIVEMDCLNFDCFCFQNKKIVSRPEKIPNFHRDLTHSKKKSREIHLVFGTKRIFPSYDKQNLYLRLKNPKSKNEYNVLYRFS